MSRARVDWDAIEPHYRAGLRSLKDLGAEFEVSDAAIIKHARAKGWDRNLKAKIQAKADAKVSAAMVSAEVSETKALTEAVRIEVEAEVQARIRLTHRTDIGKYRAMGMNLAAELEAMGADEKLAVRSKVFKDLVDTLKTLAALEREAYGLEAAAPPVAPTQDMTDPAALTEVARRLAFTFANARHAESRTTH